MAETLTNDGEIIRQFLEAAKKEIEGRMPTASGATKASLEVVMSREAGNPGGSLFGAPYIFALEDGRGPTLKNVASKDGTLQSKILKWLETRGIAARDGKTLEQTSWAMATKIHNEGNELYRNGGNSGVISNSFMPKRIEALIKTFGSNSVKMVVVQAEQLKKQIESRNKVNQR